jgi:AcrR family transcriptional regulator
VSIDSTNSPARGEQLRERRRQRTADEIQRAALDLFAEQGFEKVSIDEIADAVAISRRTFFRYYASKEDLVLGDAARRSKVVVSALEERPADEPVLDSLFAAMVAMAASHEEDPELVLKRLAVLRRSPDVLAKGTAIRRVIDESVTAIVAKRMDVDPAIDTRPTVLTRACVAAVEVAFERWYLGGGVGSLQEETSLVLEALRESFSSDS